MSALLWAGGTIGQSSWPDNNVVIVTSGMATALRRCEVGRVDAFRIIESRSFREPRFDPTPHQLMPYPAWWLREFDQHERWPVSLANTFAMQTCCKVAAPWRALNAPSLAQRRHTRRRRSIHLWRRP